MLTCTILVSALISFVIVVGEEQKIETVLRSKWSPTSILFEGSEFVADVDQNLFWKYVDNAIAQQPFLPSSVTNNGSTAERQLASIAAFPLLSSANLRLMDWALTSRAYSPKVLLLQRLDSRKPENCGGAYVVFGKNRVYCDLSAVKEIVEAGIPFAESEVPVIIDADHKYPSFVWSSKQKLIAILHGDLSSSDTKIFHDYLNKACNNSWQIAFKFSGTLRSKADLIGYILRPLEKTTDGKGAPLAGYGIELQFKSTEYKAQDDSAKEKENPEIAGFIFDKLHELHPDHAEDLDKFQHHLAAAKGKKAEFEALKAWQVQELGLQASHYTTLQNDFLEALLDISGNFPSKASALSSIRVPNEFKKSVAYNQRILQSHFNIDEAEGAIFLQGNYVDPDALDIFAFQDTLRAEIDFMEILKSIYQDQTKTRRDVEALLAMGSKSHSEPDLALDLRDASVIWINDLEKDEEYEDWPDDLTQLFFRMGGVMLRPVRRNVFNLLLTLNPDDETSAGAMLKLAQSFMAHKAPLRIGVVFCSGNELSNSIEEPKSVTVRRVLNHALADDSVKRAFNIIVEAYSTNDFSTVIKLYEKAGEEYDFGNELACEFIKKGGRPTPGAFLNGVPLKWDSVDDFEEIVLNQLLREAQVIQIEAYNGKIRDDTDIFDYIMNKPHVQTRLNDKILDTSNSKYYSFGTEVWEPGKTLKTSLGTAAVSLNYLSATGKHTSPASVSIWVLADVTTQDGVEFFLNALNFISESAKHSRLALLPTGNIKVDTSREIQRAIAENNLEYLRKLLASPVAKETSNELDDDDMRIKAALMSINFPMGGKGVIVNGRLIGPLAADETFDVGDWALIEKYTYDSCAKHLVTEGTEPDSIMRICAAISDPAAKSRNSKRFSLPEFKSTKDVYNKKDIQDPFYVELVAVVDPASRVANKIASILSALNSVVSQWVKIQVVFNPPAKHSELPLKSYFRFVAGETTVDKVVFEDIPKEPLFTQNIITPDNWMVEVVRSIHDLDNIRLRELSTSVSSEYELEYLLVEGHCLESKTGSPPRGLQFTLTPDNEEFSPTETIVMANLGYFQLKAEPGLWKLELRDGPSKEIYSIEGQINKAVYVQSFQSIVMKVKVKRNPGKESTSLLDSEEESKGWFGFGGKSESDEEVLNIFSVASGHLYERLLRIMMLSVLKNTKSKVKFWFLKNYLSPSIKDILPEMAREYGFDYELVQYHWPRWLNPQREKQRIIWGYKILFLDVLFPLSLKKIVFVDADQIVRADMKELFDLDLEGNPYGYSPFCDSRTEMEGFRFWKKGYWKSHLGKRKYHISALYVVDLVRFRRIAAGDRLRGQYQALSQDPNSLSNLDQDLPNNMIHQVGIKSLPQEWLWCETWCSDDSKQYAKTIDLCNNPQTKEPKLEAAKRIAPEWESYDQEIRDFQAKVEKGRKPSDHDEL